MTVTRRQVLAGTAAVAATAPMAARAACQPGHRRLGDLLAEWQAADTALGDIDMYHEPQPIDEWEAALSIEEGLFAAILAFPVRTEAEFAAKAAFLCGQIDREGRDFDGNAVTILMRSGFPGDPMQR